jgi:hypothetical protein
MSLGSRFPRPAATAIPSIAARHRVLTWDARTEMPPVGCEVTSAWIGREGTAAGCTPPPFRHTFLSYESGSVCP